jgi:glycosyltransferase involved in cell wall biosynthesis
MIEDSATLTDRSSLAMRMPPTSLIICSRNRPGLLLDSVVSVLSGNVVPNEILIMDQSDEEHPVLATLGDVYGCYIRYVRTNARGECPARNEGILLACHELLVFTDDDVIAPPEWFECIVKAQLCHGADSVITGRVLAGYTDNVEGFAPSLKADPDPAVYRGRPGMDVLFPMNMSLYRGAWEEVGGFDVRLGAGGPFPGAEDNDIGFRLLEAGYQIVYAPEAMIYHRAWRSKRDYLPLCWNYGFCQGAFYAKHLDLVDRYILNRMRRELCSYAGTALLPRSNRTPTERLGDVVFLAGVFYGIAKWLATQRIIS